MIREGSGWRLERRATGMVTVTGVPPPESRGGSEDGIGSGGRREIPRRRGRRGDTVSRVRSSSVTSMASSFRSVTCSLLTSMDVAVRVSRQGLGRGDPGPVAASGDGTPSTDGVDFSLPREESR